MTGQDKKIATIYDLLNASQKSLNTAKQLMREVMQQQGIRAGKPEFELDTLHSYDSWEAKVIEWVFTGENMLGVDKNIYPVPQNYASKSLLVQWSKLKATIWADGRIVYKIIDEIPYETLTGTIIKDKDRFQILANGKVYNVLMASITYYKWNVGDTVSVRIPQGKQATFACVEAVIPKEVPDDLELEIQEINSGNE